MTQHRRDPLLAVPPLLATILIALSGPGPAEAAARPGGGPPAGEAVQDPGAPAAQAQDGFIPVTVDPATGKVFLEVTRLDQDLLYLNTLATGLGSNRASLDRGQVGEEALVRFQRHGPRVLLLRRNDRFVASSGDPAEARSVEESFPSSVLASFPIQEGEVEGGPLRVDATDFFLSDVYDVRGALRRAELGEVRLDRDRSFVDAGRTRAFPRNTEVRAVLTFATDSPHPELARHAPDGRSVTLEQHHSFVELPGPGFRPREFDPRSGNNPVVQDDLSQGFDAEPRRRLIARWRLEKRDPSAAVSEPVEPIVYHLDRGIPEPYRSAFIEGGMWWNEIFEAAGFRNAFQIRDLPEDADPMDARYSVISWVHRTGPGPSVGPSYRDPRTGEIIKTVVRMDSHRSLIDHNIFAGLLPAFGDDAPQIDAREFAMARRRQHTAHEIGHTLGLPHNHAAAAQGRSSVMDYPFPLIRLDDQGRLDIADAYRPGGGFSDTLSIRYAYTQFATPEEEARGLRAIVNDALDRGHRFVTGGHAAQSGSYPEVTQWVEGSTMFEALDRSMAVRRVLLERFDERAVLPGEPMAWLAMRLAHVYLHHRYSLEGVVKYVGGMEFSYALRGDGQTPTRVIPAGDQRRALDRIMTALSPGELAVPDHVPDLVPPVPFGFQAREPWIASPAGTALDPVAMARSLAQEVVDNLLHRERMARVAWFHARDAGQPSVDEVLTRLVDGTWGDLGSREGSAGAYRRAVERAVLDGLFTLASDARATADVRAVAERHLAQIGWRLGTAAAGTVQDEAHQSLARREVERYLAEGVVPPLRTGVIAMPLPWP